MPTSPESIPRWTRPRRLVAAVWFILTVVLGVAGYLEWWGATPSPKAMLQALYSTAQLFVLQTPTFDRPVNGMLEASRWMAALFLGGTVYQVGKALLAHELGAWRLRRLAGHVVITGLGRRGLACAQAERARSRTRGIVVVDRRPDPVLARACLELGARVVEGDAADPEVLARAGVGRASALYALCPDDGTNCETAVQARALRDARTVAAGQLECHVHVTDVDLRVELQRHAATAPGSAASVRFFDMFDVEARRLLLHALPIDHDGVPPADPRRVHLVILGFGRMGRTLAARAAKLGHFANAVGSPDRRLRVSVIDREAPAREAALLFRYRGFRLAADLEFHQLELESSATRDLLEGWCGDAAALTSVAVCVDDEPRAVEFSLGLLPMLDAHDVRVAVRVARRRGLAALLETALHARRRVVRFGVIDEACWEESFRETTDERLARIIHQRFVEQRVAEGRDPVADRALAPWADLGEDLRESNRQQADHVAIKLRAVGLEAASAADPQPAITDLGAELDPAGLETLAAMEHDRWNAERWLSGWRFAPGPKNLAARTSPYLVPWSELSEAVREYDRQSVRLLPELLAGIGAKVCRRAGAPGAQRR